MSESTDDVRYDYSNKNGEWQSPGKMTREMYDKICAIFPVVDHNSPETLAVFHYDYRSEFTTHRIWPCEVVADKSYHEEFDILNLGKWPTVAKPSVIKSPTFAGLVRERKWPYDLDAYERASKDWEVFVDKRLEEKLKCLRPDAVSFWDSEYAPSVTIIGSVATNPPEAEQ